jgi:hypothetical protein
MAQSYVAEEEQLNQKLSILFKGQDGLKRYDALTEVLDLADKAELDRRATTFALFSALHHA